MPIKPVAITRKLVICIKIIMVVRETFNVTVPHISPSLYLPSASVQKGGGGWAA